MYDDPPAEGDKPLVRIKYFSGLFPQEEVKIMPISALITADQEQDSCEAFILFAD